jgi:hypothetical protein
MSNLFSSPIEISQFLLVCIMSFFNTMRRLRKASLLVVYLPLIASAKTPDCSGTDRWPTNMAFVHLSNAGITSNEKVDFTKTKTIRLASEIRGKDLYRQIHQVTFFEKSGSTIQVITSNDVSSEECSMSGVDVYVVSQIIKDRR